MVEALKAVRWMSKQRNAEGGFTSTQDTVLGLEALTKYAAAMSSNATDLSVLVTASELDQVYRMHNDNRMVLTQIHLPVIPTIVEIFAEGEGCVLVQVSKRGKSVRIAKGLHCIYLLYIHLYKITLYKIVYFFRAT